LPTSLPLVLPACPCGKLKEKSGSGSEKRSTKDGRKGVWVEMGREAGKVLGREVGRARGEKLAGQLEENLARY
jgi:hypothetical protein